jgi:hypothetical protein
MACAATPAAWRFAANRRAEIFLKMPDEQLLISFSEILFVSRALETTNGG